MNYSDLKKELLHKERRIGDVIRFLSNRTDNNPNYTLLLGAGCSVTSGIRTGGNLIEEWRKEIYLQLSNENSENYNSEDAKNFLNKNHGAWYNISNEYSSLFEKKYDLPRQRRVFVEKEVSDKTPSIGYAYLMNLVKEKYFNTLFTTNFDDLINEAFYQFSDSRPIVCAHDSSINSITITSKRPKIIKLHGDYLFDDIKSTLRETESLENNIRNKFIEFAKDFGLIVVGYSGNDRSIMDILNYLLKNEEYYMNGIYWCIRKDDEISEELRKLLWKERVYFVEIEGFDEFFAELHFKLLDNKLPIDTNFISNKSQDIVKKFIDNKFLRNSNSEIILDNLKNLELQNERNNIYEILKELRSDKDISNNKFTNKEIKILIEISNLFKQERYSDVEKCISNNIGNSDNVFFKIELLKDKFNVYKRLKDTEKIEKILDELLELDMQNPIHYIQKIQIENTKEKKNFFINKAIEQYPHHEIFLNLRVKFYLEEIYKNHYKIEEKDYEELIENINLSLMINPSIDNDAWMIKSNLIRRNKKNCNHDIENIIENMEKQKPYYIDVLDLKYSLIKDKEEKLNFIDYISTSSLKYHNHNKLNYELLKINILDDLNMKDELNQKILELDKNNLYKNEPLYLNKKANILLEKFNRIDESIELVKKSLEIKKNVNSIAYLIKLYCYNNNINEAKRVLSKYKYYLNLLEYFNSEILILEYEENYLVALEKINEKILEYPDQKDDLIIRLSYFYILDENINDAKNCLHSFLTTKNFSPNYSVQIVNYEYSCKLLNDKFNKKRLEDVQKYHSEDKLLEIAILAINEGGTNDLYKKIKESIEKDCETKYIMNRWPILKNILKLPKFAELLD